MSSFNEEYYKSIGGILESNDYTEQSNLFKVSWALHEGYKDVSEKLDDLIPLEGAVPQGRSVNKCLEKFRVAQNLIYDLFNKIDSNTFFLSANCSRKSLILSGIS